MLNIKGGWTIPWGSMRGPDLEQWIMDQVMTHPPRKLDMIDLEDFFGEAWLQDTGCTAPPSLTVEHHVSGSVMSQPQHPFMGSKWDPGGREKAAPAMDEPCQWFPGQCRVKKSTPTA